MLMVLKKIPRGAIYNFLYERRVVLHLSSGQSQLKESQVEEVKIPVPWGHIAGKWWGDKSLTPVLAIHGWQDNANTYDKLLPLLNLQSVLSIDLPGHGLSSHLPHGKLYEMREFLICIHRIQKYYNWKNMAILGHSFGSAVGFAYCAVFPNDVKWMINLECGRTLLILYKSNLALAFNRVIDHFLKFEKRITMSNHTPTYLLSKLVYMTIEGSLGSISTPEAALTLLKRGIVPASKPLKEMPEKNRTSDLNDFLVFNTLNSKKLAKSFQEEVSYHNNLLLASLQQAKLQAANFKLNPEDDKYYTLSRDPMIRVLFFHTEGEEFLLEESKNIKCPCLNIRAKQGFLYGNTRRNYEQSIEVLKKSSTYFEAHEVQGTHHTHLNSPQEMSLIINNFLEKIKN